MQKAKNDRILLEVKHIFAGYTEFDILKDVNLHVCMGEIVSIIGLNGAGKSTIIKVIYGLLKQRRGTIFFNGDEVSNYRPQDMLKAGVGLVPQSSSIFPQMSVYENLEFGMYLDHDRTRIRKRIEEIFDLFPLLKDLKKLEAGKLSGGERRSLEIGRALMANPKLLIMDEPSAGLSIALSNEIFLTIKKMNQEMGVAFLIIEQNVRKVLEISHRAYLFELGQNRMEGSGKVFLLSRDINKNYLEPL